MQSSLPHHIGTLGRERYDRELADVFAIQDEITEAATIAIAPALPKPSYSGPCANRWEASTLGPPISAGCGIWASSSARTTRSRRSSFGRRSISTRPLPEGTEGRDTPNSRQP